MQGELRLHSSHLPFSKVSFAERHVFSHWLQTQYLHKQRVFASMLGKGIASVLGAVKDGLFSAQELMSAVIGSQDINIDQLKANTHYEGYSEKDTVIGWFWEVLQEMTALQRTLFLQFTTARSRLPLFHNQSSLNVPVESEGDV